MAGPPTRVPLSPAMPSPASVTLATASPMLNGSPVSNGNGNSTGHGAAAPSPAASSSSSLPMSARPQPEAGPSRSPRPMLVQGLPIGVNGSPLLNAAGLVGGSPLTGLAGMTGSPATTSAAEFAVTGASANAHGAAESTSLQSVLNGAAGLAGHDQALKKQFDALNSTRQVQAQRNQQTPRAASTAIPLPSSSPAATGMTAPSPSLSASAPTPTLTPATAPERSVNGVAAGASPAQSQSSGVAIGAGTSSSNGAVPSHASPAGPTRTSTPAAALGPSPVPTPAAVAPSPATAPSPANAPSPADANRLRSLNIPLLPNGQIDHSRLHSFANSLSTQQKEMIKAQQRERMRVQAAMKIASETQQAAIAGGIETPAVPTAGAVPAPGTAMHLQGGDANSAFVASSDASKKRARNEDEDGDDALEESPSEKAAIAAGAVQPAAATATSSVPVSTVAADQQSGAQANPAQAGLVDGSAKKRARDNEDEDESEQSPTKKAATTGAGKPASVNATSIGPAETARVEQSGAVPGVGAGSAAEGVSLADAGKPALPSTTEIAPVNTEGGEQRGAQGSGAEEKIGAEQPASTTAIPAGSNGSGDQSKVHGQGAEEAASVDAGKPASETVTPSVDTGSAEQSSEQGAGTQGADIAGAGKPASVIATPPVSASISSQAPPVPSGPAATTPTSTQAAQPAQPATPAASAAPAAPGQPGQPGQSGQPSLVGAQPPQAQQSQQPQPQQQPQQPPQPQPSQTEEAIEAARKRKSFIQSYGNYHRTARVQIHPDVVKSAPQSVMRIGETEWTYELMELFLTIYKFPKVTFEQYIAENPQAPLIQSFSRLRGLPPTLPKSVKVPVPVNTEPSRETSDTVQYLVEAFRVYLGGYYQHMQAMRAAQIMQKAQVDMQAAQAKTQTQAQTQAQAQAQTTQAGGAGGSSQGVPPPPAQPPQQPQQRQSPSQQPQPQQQQQQPQPPTPASAIAPTPPGVPNTNPGALAASQQPSQPQRTGVANQAPQANLPIPQPQQQQLERQQRQQQAQTQQTMLPPQMQAPGPPPHAGLMPAANGPAPSPMTGPAFNGRPPAPPPAQPGQVPMGINININGLPSHIQPGRSHSNTPSPPSANPSGRGRPPKNKPGKVPPILTDLQTTTQLAMGPPMPEMTLDSAKLAGKKRKAKDQPVTPVGSAHGASSAQMQARMHHHPYARPQQQQQQQQHHQQQQQQQLPPPPPPKRARFKIEYKPVKMHLPGLPGFEQTAVISTFAKHNMRPNSRSVHDLKVVDMDAILMGLRSRLPNQLGYAITVLSMLSLAYPDSGTNGLPLGQLPEIFEELLELLADEALGEDGLDGWKGRAQKRQSEDKKRVLFSELQKLGQDRDYSFEASEYHKSPDIVLALLNLLRNFSMYDENKQIMALNPDLLHLLVAVSDPSLCTAFGGSLYTVIELARVQRDAISILANIGELVDLRRCEWPVVKSLYRLLASFLVPAWELTRAASIHNIVYGPPSGDRPPILLSIARALEAFVKITGPDVNREILARVPGAEVVELYAALIKLLPVTPVQFHHVNSYEEVLCFAEFAGLALYSLAFLASPATRAEMRKVPGAVDIVTRIVLYAAPLRSHPQAPPGTAPQPGPLAILARRLAEMLGVLNGTWTAGGGVAGPTGMGFGAGGVEGKGWTFKSSSVEPGWLAGRQEAILKALEMPMENVVWQELDNLLWGQQ